MKEREEKICVVETQIFYVHNKMQVSVYKYATAANSLDIGRLCHREKNNTSKASCWCMTRRSV